MSRTITVLYDSRAEAETARERLATELNARATRLIGKDTIAAIDGVGLEKKYAFTLRQSLRRGASVVIAEVPSGTTADRVMRLLGLSIRADTRSDESSSASTLHYGIAKTEDAPGQEHDVGQTLPGEETAEQPFAGSLPPQPESKGIQNPSQLAASALSPENSSTLRDHGQGYTALSEAEADAAGLFKERTIDFAEMREEAIVTKEAIVREEVIVTKTVKERTETIRDTVRRTEFEVEPLGGRR